MGRIVVVSQFFPPELFAGANRVASLAEALATKHSVSVVTLQPSYPEPSSYDSRAAETFDESAGYAITRLFAAQRHPASLAKRAFREQMIAVRLALGAMRERAPDVFVTSSPGMFLGPAVWLASRARRAMFVWELRDITWQFASEGFARSRTARIATALLERLMWSIARRADMVVAATDGAVRLLTEHGVSPDRIVLAPNTISTALFDAIRSSRAGRPPRKDRPIVAYVGLLGYLQGLSVLIEAARRLPDVDFLLVGDGQERPLLEKKAADAGLVNVTFAGFLERDGVVDVYRKSDILFAQLNDAPTLNSATIPSKIFEYMAAGRPIVYGGKGLAAQLLEEVGCGVTVPPDDPHRLEQAIRHLLANPERMRELGKRGSDYVEPNAKREDVMASVVTALSERLGVGEDPQWIGARVSA